MCFWQHHIQNPWHKRKHTSTNNIKQRNIHHCFTVRQYKHIAQYKIREGRFWYAIQCVNSSTFCLGWRSVAVTVLCCWHKRINLLLLPERIDWVWCVVCLECSWNMYILYGTRYTFVGIYVINFDWIGCQISQLQISNILDLKTVTWWEWKVQWFYRVH